MSIDYESDGIQEFRSAALIRSLMADPERSHRGEVLLSAETGESTDSIHDLVQDSPGVFFRLIRGMSPHERSVMISYHVLHKPQASIAVALGLSSQGRVGAVLKEGVEFISGQRRKIHRRGVQPVIQRQDHESLGQFRVKMSDAQYVLSSYGSPREIGMDCE